MLERDLEGADSLRGKLSFVHLGVSGLIIDYRVIRLIQHRLLQRLPRVERVCYWLIRLPLRILDHPLFVVRDARKRGLLDCNIWCGRGGVCSSKFIQVVGLFVEEVGVLEDVDGVVLRQLLARLRLVEFIFHICESEQDLVIVEGISVRFQSRLRVLTRDVFEQSFALSLNLLLLGGLD